MDDMLNDPKVRRELARMSHQHFMAAYLSNHVGFATAPFQKEMFRLTEDDSIKTAVVVAFRGSAKSTIMTLSYPIWSIVGRPQAKFVLILSQTQAQVRLHMMNIRRELESNEMLRKELGPFQTEEDEWGNTTIVLAKYGARITAASIEQSIRGLRHGAHRPDVIIGDDIEDIASTRTRENRDKTWRWLTGEVLLAGHENTKFIIVGNLLHEDSVMMRLKRGIELGERSGVFRSFPLIDADGKIAWPGRFPTMKEINEYRHKVGDERTWQREMLLKIIPEDDQLIRPEWLRYHDRRPGRDSEGYHGTYVGIDPAISKKDRASYTAMVAAEVYGSGDDLRVYILPHPVNLRLSFNEAAERAQKLSADLEYNDTPPRLYVEEVGYQGALTEVLNGNGCNATGVGVAGADKRARLSVVSGLVQTGRVLFPERGAEALISQLVGFDVERHNDLADAFSLLLREIMKDGRGGADHFSIGGRMMMSDMRPSSMGGPIPEAVDVDDEEDDNPWPATPRRRR